MIMLAGLALGLIITAIDRALTRRRRARRAAAEREAES